MLLGGFVRLTLKAAARVSASSPQGDPAFACYSYSIKVTATLNLGSIATYSFSVISNSASISSSPE